MKSDRSFLAGFYYLDFSKMATNARDLFVLGRSDMGLFARAGAVGDARAEYQIA